MRRAGFPLLLLFALSASAAPVKYCDGLLSRVDAAALPEGLRTLLNEPGLIQRVGFAPQSPEMTTFFNQLATSIESGGPRTFTLDWAKRSKVVATIVPEGGASYRILLAPRQVSKSELLDLHALQFGIAQHLYERIPAKKLDRIRIEWSNESGVFLGAKETMQRLGYLPAEVEKSCGRGRRFVIAAGVISGTGFASFLGFGAGPLFDDIWGDGQDLDRTAIWTAIGTGTVAGGGLTTLAVLRCRPRTRDASYLLEITRAPVRARAKRASP
jgi:hypothetical protein